MFVVLKSCSTCIADTCHFGWQNTVAIGNNIVVMVTNWLSWAILHYSLGNIHAERQRIRNRYRKQIPCKCHNHENSRSLPSNVIEPLFNHIMIFAKKAKPKKKQIMPRACWQEKIIRNRRIKQTVEAYSFSTPRLILSTYLRHGQKGAKRENLRLIERCLASVYDLYC